MREVDPARYYDSHPLNPYNDKDEPYTNFYISDFPFPGHVGEVTDRQEKLLDQHNVLLDRRYNDEDEFNKTLHTLANAFRLDCEGSCYTEDGRGHGSVKVSPKVDWDFDAR